MAVTTAEVVSNSIDSRCIYGNLPASDPGPGPRARLASGPYPSRSTRSARRKSSGSGASSRTGARVRVDISEDAESLKIHTLQMQPVQAPWKAPFSA